MIGAILGDIIGSPYEFDRNNIKTTEFPLFCTHSQYTDDTVMTVAVAEGLMNAYGHPDQTEAEIVKSMRHFGRLFPNAGYGSRFGVWLVSRSPKPYGSYGNGSAMRVSPVAWLYNDLNLVEHFAKISSKVTHNHPEGIKGAQATASAIFMARSGKTKSEIRRYLEVTYKYNLSRSLEEIRPGYRHVESCQESVPEAITAFLASDSFEDAIRKAVSLGGDSDTIAAIAGSIAEGCFGIPDDLKEKAKSMLDAPLLAVVQRWEIFLSGLSKQ